MTPEQFGKKWGGIRLKEQSAAQSHFNDICAVVGHQPPVAFDPTGERFAFEKRVESEDGKTGRADVWFKGHFVWEYKSRGKSLDEAYHQLQRYKDALDNPPLLITSDMDTIIIRTNFTGTVRQTYTVSLEDIVSGDGVALLKRVFFQPETFRPTMTRDEVTRATADSFLTFADTVLQYNPNIPRENLAHFFSQILFTLFAEDSGLLPNAPFRTLTEHHIDNLGHFTAVLRNLFDTMREGGFFGSYFVPHFNGELFHDNDLPPLPSDVMSPLLNAMKEDWSNIDPTIFGTLFERVIDVKKRAQLGAHYTGVEDIMLIVEPVVMEPLRERWEAVRREARRQLREDKHDAAHDVVAQFAREIAETTVLDPACGSGNFLYVALQQLLGLQKEVIAYAEYHGLPPIPLTVSPHQLYGIEVNPYAHALAQITIWIGYIQWRLDGGFAEIDEPILRPLNQIECKDAILAYDADGNPAEPTWPATTTIVGNPPFLGISRLRSELGAKRTDDMFALYDHLPNTIDLVCYWYARAAHQIEQGKAKRAGLLATQTIRSGRNRAVLEYIKQIGDIFFAWSDREWVLEGASVRVSMIGFFADKTRKRRLLDGKPVKTIYADLTSSLDLTTAVRLLENFDISYEGVKKTGAFDIPQEDAMRMIDSPNSDVQLSNRDVLKPLINGNDVLKRSTNRWIIDFGTSRTLEEAKKFEKPFAHVLKFVKPQRDKVRRKATRERWWLFGETRPGMRNAIEQLPRFIVTTRVAKHRIFTFLPQGTLPDSRLYVFGRDDDYFFGVLHSRIHQLWSLATSSRHGDGKDGGRPTYNNTTCFETFPFPWRPGEEPTEDERVKEIGIAARDVVTFRQAWLHPAEEIDEKRLKTRTLTHLYNALAVYKETHTIETVRADITLTQIEELADIHADLDTAVLNAYGWAADLTDEEILGNLLALNEVRSHQS